MKNVKQSKVKFWSGLNYTRASIAKALEKLFPSRLRLHQLATFVYLYTKHIHTRKREDNL